MPSWACCRALAHRVGDLVEAGCDRHRGLGGVALQAGVAGRAAQAGEAAAQGRDGVAQAVAGIGGAMHGLDAGEQAFTHARGRRLAAAIVALGDQGGVHVTLRLAELDAERHAIGGERDRRRGLARVARRVGIGDVLRDVRQRPLGREQAVPCDAEGEVETHGRITL
jgi:hypothetical protein